MIPITILDRGDLDPLDRGLQYLCIDTGELHESLSTR